MIPALLLLIVGLLEFGLAFKDQLAITSAVRAGARIASAEPRYVDLRHRRGRARSPRRARPST